MLTVEKCRALLNDYTSSDEEIESLRSALYSTAELTFDTYWIDGGGGSKNPFWLLTHNPSIDTVLICNKKSIKPP